LSPYLLDTQILVRWREDWRKLSRPQARVIADAERRGLQLAISAITLCELASIAGRGLIQVQDSVEAWLLDIENNPLILVLPITVGIAAETLMLGGSFPRDPADRIIAATARRHGLKLLTADERIRESGAVSII